MKQNQDFLLLAKWTLRIGAISTVIIIHRKWFPGSQMVSSNPSKALGNAAKSGFPTVSGIDAGDSRYHALQGWALSYSCTVWCIQLVTHDPSRTHMSPWSGMSHEPWYSSPAISSSYGGWRYFPSALLPARVADRWCVRRRRRAQTS